MEKYKDKSISIKVRADDLLSRMTLKEKVSQLNQKMFGWNAYIKTVDGYELTGEFKEQVDLGQGMGALYGLFRADPWSQIAFENGIAVKDSARVANMIQRYVIENTRLGIPLLISEECPHGHQALEGTMFPTNIGVGSTWNPKLYEQAYSYVAEDIRARGGNLGLVSALDILREPRWGRAEECFSEDPYLASRFTKAAVTGLQGNSTEDLARQDKVAAVLKHFCAQGECTGGHNQGPASIGERELREIHILPMKAGIEAGAAACMAAYNEIDGIPCHANEYLLTQILREELGFEGIVMADGIAIDRLLVQTCDYEQAAALALSSGVDLSLWDKAYMTLEEAVKNHKINEMFIDRAVRRILSLKFRLGLFDNPYTDEELAGRVIGKKQCSNINLQLAQESVVLLENKNSILPLSKELKKIAVIGPNADNIYNQLGDYTPPQIEGAGITVRDGIVSLVSENTEVIYKKGCSLHGNSREEFGEAIEAAKSSDAVVLVLGGCSTRDFNVKFDTNGAAMLTNDSNEMDCGEGIDAANLNIGNIQMDLFKEIITLGKPVITVLIQGRPHSIQDIAENCGALLCAWYPGQEGGRAIAQIIFGEINPSGKLPVSIPRSSAQLPVYYNYKEFGSDLQYIDMPGKPLYPFGFGRSYTKFKIFNVRLSNPEISVSDLDDNQRVEIEADIQNIGKSEGAEVIQLYIKDMEASIVRRVKELKGFEKVNLKPDERKIVKFFLGKEELGIWDKRMKFVVEPGNIKITIGNDSITGMETSLKIID